jgi:hypothetical protein
MMMQAIKTAIKPPGAGEKREQGHIDKTECNNKGIYFYLHTETQTLKLFSSSPRAIRFRTFVPDMEGLQLGCTMKSVEMPVVFLYKDAPDAKLKTAGEILSLDFVPKTFTLDK